MNLPAVLLFICFSTGYGLYCKTGGRALRIYSDGSRIEAYEAPITNDECTSDNGIPLCMRFVYENPEIRGDIGYACSRALPWCNDKRDGECFKGRIHTSNGALATICCSTDPEFGNLESTPVKDPSPDDFSPSETDSDKGRTIRGKSAISTRGLLAIITVLFGRFF